MFISTFIHKVLGLRSMSAFPRRFRSFTEPLSATEDVQIPVGTSLPGLIRLYYKIGAVKAIAAKWGFLSRDNKERLYDPAKEDGFVFSGMHSITDFQQSADRIVSHLADEAIALDLPTVKDQDRGVTVIDSEKVVADLERLDQTKLSSDQDFALRLAAVQFIIGNTDIIKKACIVRTVIPGWWASSYKGKNSNQIDYFVPALIALRKSLVVMRASAVFKARYDYLWDTNSDPIDTNPGYPYFNVQMDTQGNPVIRDVTVDQFKTVLDKAQYFAQSDHRSLKWIDVLRAVDALNVDETLDGHPLAVAPLRRLSPGYKWNHIFTVTAAGMRTHSDVRGQNSQRIAWMVPYIYNLLISPMSTALKTVRSFLPGCTHTASDKRFQNLSIRSGDNSKSPILFEADYSNYDRFIPVDVIEHIVRMVAELFSDNQTTAYWHDALMHLHDGASLIWPDYTATETGRGWIFQPGRLGLLSGVKVTSETGTLVNFIINLSNCYHAGILRTEKEMIDYTLSIFHKQTINDLEENSYRNIPSSFSLKFLVQSDDTLLIGRTLMEGLKLAKAFEKGLKAAGLKGAVEAGDRFLMRHMNNGADRPVPCRVWQNTLSGEAAPESELIFLLGLLARTDGMFGIKQVDPFNTGSHQRITSVEFRTSLLVVKELLSFLQSAAVKSQRAVQLLTVYVKNCARVEKQLDLSTLSWVSLSNGEAKSILDYRNELTEFVIQLEQQLNAQEKASSLFNLSDKYNRWILSLAKDKHVPSAALITEYLVKIDPTVASRMNAIGSIEQNYFKKSIKAMRIKPLTLS